MLTGQKAGEQKNIRMPGIEFLCRLGPILFVSSSLYLLIFCLVFHLTITPYFPIFSVNFDHFQILRAIGKGSFGKVSQKMTSFTFGSNMITLPPTTHAL